ncbi:hypothetical protein H696_00681 [Fonticula alba]|uniref:Sulfatase N-terminal domain-containing protein n=1 Tax=Fonticula alba TaxID=691883 RepID=A0A058ZGS1_FONAL|nr:hypothetical protein H696_00681 [Fonticula alba]KCV73133.1 hypothetical protein H696_00681 [Fonticula alba]|eukprot:XP_009492834.1 hypothetical protein H696_00681 [Fonticula alba]
MVIAASKPFFVLVSYLQPHIPVFANSRFKGSSRRGAFGDMMHEMDDSIGRVMAALEERGLTGDTLVVFTSDNGAWPDAREPLVDEDLSDDQPHGGSNGPFQQGKGSTWEGGVREPTIISWPNGSIKSGATSMEIASHMDVLPTVLEAAGVSVPTDRTIDGRSLLPHMRGLTSSGPHDAYFYWREREVYAVRLGRYKAHFVTRPGFGNDRPVRHNPPLLFDLEADMGEQYPLDSAGRYADLIADMRRRVAEHRTTIEAVEPQYEFGGTILPGVDFSVVPCCNPMALQEFTIEQLVNDHWEQCRCDYLSGQAPASPEEGTTGESATEAERSVRRTAQELLAADLTRGGHSSTAAVMAELLLKQMSGPRHT